MRVLGISAFQRNSAAALAVDGRVVAAAREGRFTRLAGDSAFPSRAIRAVLHRGELQAPELDAVVFYEKPLRKFERVLVNHLRAFPRSSVSFSRSVFLWLGERLWVKNRIVADLGVPAERVLFAEHLHALGMSAAGTSGRGDGALLVVDDVGEWATTLLARVRAGRLEPLAEVLHPHSLGLVASAVTQFLGFIPGEEEHKVEALAAWGEPRFLEVLRRWVPVVDGLFRVDQSPFRFTHDSDRLHEEALVEALGPPRYPGDPLRCQAPDARDADLAASLQALLEERVLHLARELHRRAPGRHLSFAGALARNRTLQARLSSEGPFEEVWTPPSPGKAGGAVGAALSVPSASGALTSHCFTSEELFDAREPDAKSLPAGAVSELVARLERQERVAWVRGPLEFSPHSMGGRLALSDARGADARVELLRALQQVEPFLPARVLLRREDRARYVDVAGAADGALAQAQLLVPATPELRTAAPSAILPNGLCWPQSVDRDDQPELHELLTRCGRVLLATDFLLRGSPLVRGESDAVAAFRRSGLSALVVGDRLYERS